MSAIGPRKRAALIRDLAARKLDVCTLAHDHHLPEAAVAAFMAEAETRQLLANLCAAADYEAQLMMSRYRAIAAGRLIGLAAGKGASGAENADDSAGNAGAVPPDVARKACLDLLRTELARTAADLAPPPPSEAEDAEQAQELREALYEKEE